MKSMKLILILKYMLFDLFNSPFEQFRIIYIKIAESYYVSTATIELLVLMFFSILAYFFMLRYSKYNYLILGLNYFYVSIHQNTKTYLGKKKTNIVFPFFYYLFMVIFACNSIGLLPYSLTLTSQLYVTLCFSIVSWFGIFYIGVSKWGKQIFSLFIPEGISVYLVFFLIIIETFSYIFRIFSLALRLFANIVAGHILIDCIVFFIYKTMYMKVFYNSVEFLFILQILVPFIFLLVLYSFELVVAFLQAYIFITLNALYLKEVL